MCADKDSASERRIATPLYSAKETLMSKYDYLIDKIRETPFTETPFKHLYISDFFTEEHFNEIVGSPEIDLEAAESDEDLFEKLGDAGYKVVRFPGCITDKKAYMKWHAKKGSDNNIHTACEGFGITLRLFDVQTPAIKEVNEFLLSEKFNRALAAKFDIEYARTTPDNGIQKYLDGYEISPHPDIRRKALTFMVNINPHEDASERVHHTHYLKFREDRENIYDYWTKNEDVERCWVPWDWCDTVKVQDDNNSIVIFSPNNHTLHGVKAQYDHLDGQRTQLYGNLWYPEDPTLKQREWEFFDGRIPEVTTREKVTRLVPAGLRKTIRQARKKFQDADLGQRDF